MSLPRYPEYKDSTLAWLGELPAHWAAKPLKIAASINDDALPETTLPDFELSYVDIGNVSLGAGIKRTEDFMFSAAPSRARRLVRDGDVIVSTVRTYLKAIAPIVRPPENLVVSTGFAVVRPSTLLDSCFAKYALQSQQFVDQVISRSTGVSYPAINASDLGRIEVPFPPKVEQSIIATFLDRETAKIDALIAEQEKLLALLAEKHQATISHAVTRGLNSNAPMKDSGIPWLGEVPAHWEVMRLKHVTSQITVGIVVEPSKYYVDDGVPALRSLNVKDGAISPENLVFISPESNGLLAKSKIFAGDIVVVRSGQTGTAAVVPDAFDGANCIDLIIIRKPQDGCEKFLCWFLSSHAAIRQFEGGSEGAIQKHFNIGTAANLVVAWPEPNEQREIVAFLGAELAKLTELEAMASREIGLLRERRNAMISAAVTGKIDVRKAA